jgi:hypothetical protein
MVPMGERSDGGTMFKLFAVEKAKGRMAATLIIRSFDA